MLGFLRRRRLSGAAERRLLLALARAEQEVIRTHVDNAFDVVDAVADEMPPARAVELYLDELEVDEPEATIIAQRVLSQLTDRG
ncbi:MAG TPA: hypothetical protein VMN60_04630 [Longimicrobiales bacterium]|nr:hypothetical protein [Longimicrobiales bacterium]